MNITKHVDLLAGIGALSWAVAGLFFEPLNTLVDSRAAGAFGVLALSRWYMALRDDEPAGHPDEEANP